MHIFSDEFALIQYPGNLHKSIHTLFIDILPFPMLLWKASAVLFILLLFLFSLPKKSSDSVMGKVLPSDCIGSDWVYIIGLTVGIFLLRLPNFLLPECNLDESQWIVGAATLTKDPRFWLSVDGDTSGPLVIFPLLSIILFGGSLNYATVRVFGLIGCIIPGIIFLYFSVKKLYGQQAARLSTFPLVIFTALINHRDFLAYNSEHVPFLLISASIYFYLAIDQSHKLHNGWIIIQGLVLGSIPYAKLQAVPMGIVIGLFTLFMLFQRLRDNWRLLVKSYGVLLVAVFLPSILVLMYLAMTGVFDEFWRSYILNNLHHASTALRENPKSFLYKLNGLPLLIRNSPMENFVMALTLMAACYVSAVSFNIRKIISKDFANLLFAFILFLSSCYCIIQTGSRFYHYLLLLIPPLCFLASIIIGTVTNILNHKTNNGISDTILLALVVAIVTLGFLVPEGSLALKKKSKVTFEGEKSNTAAIIEKISNPNDRMAVWGWVNKYYIESGLVQGTRFPQAHKAIMKRPLRQYFFDQYISDLLRNKPEVFVDAVYSNKWFPRKKEKREHRYFKYPRLKQLIDQHYELITEIHKNLIFKKRSEPVLPE